MIQFQLNVQKPHNCPFLNWTWTEFYSFVVFVVYQVCLDLSPFTLGCKDCPEAPQMTILNNDEINNLSGYQSCDIEDFHISDMTLIGLPIEGGTRFDDMVKNNIFPDLECAEPNLMLDMSGRCMMLPSLEETVETSNTHCAELSEQLWMNSDESWFQLVSHQTKPPLNEEHDVNPSLFDSDEADCFDPHLYIRNFPDLSDVEPNSLPTLLPEEESKRKRITLVLDLDGKRIDWFVFVFEVRISFLCHFSFFFKYLLISIW